eukprot:scaffold302404_cov47-Prasinocladus_malaysianus.AAC.2
MRKRHPELQGLENLVNNRELGTYAAGVKHAARMPGKLWGLCIRANCRGYSPNWALGGAPIGPCGKNGWACPLPGAMSPWRPKEGWGGSFMRGGKPMRSVAERAIPMPFCESIKPADVVTFCMEGACLMALGESSRPVEPGRLCIGGPDLTPFCVSKKPAWLRALCIGGGPP